MKAQKEDPELQRVVKTIQEGQQSDYEMREGDSLYFKDCLCVPANEDLKNKLLYEAHNTLFTMHPGSTKMYRDLKPYYFWPGMKKDIVDYVSKCLTCQQVKAEHQVPSGLLNPIPIPQWKWDTITMDFVTNLPLTQRKHDAVWVIVDKLTKSSHFLPIRTPIMVGSMYHDYQNRQMP